MECGTYMLRQPHSNPYMQVEYTVHVAFNSSTVCLPSFLGIEATTEVHNFRTERSYDSQATWVIQVVGLLL